MADFDELVAQAMAAPFTGWDFSWLARHSRTQGPAWDYPALVARFAQNAQTMLDMGTGGGEVLSRLPARAPRTVATEAWPPNVPVAGKRLASLGIPTVQDEGAVDNANQDGDTDQGRLPFHDESFDLVCNRHESFRAAEVSRVLAPGGTFVTQQVDYHSHDELIELLGLELPERPRSWLPLAERQVTDVGLVVEETGLGAQRIEFNDIAGIVYYLQIVSWDFPGYSLETHRQRLRALFDDVSAWPVVSNLLLFLLVASKPG
jgi:SAM-dependent methyltransferase